MEEISFELRTLEKSFPFIKFTFTKPEIVIRIWINNQDNENDYFYFSYDPELHKWFIEQMFTNKSFIKFLDKFIWGLIKHELY